MRNPIPAVMVMGAFLLAMGGCGGNNQCTDCVPIKVLVRVADYVPSPRIDMSIRGGKLYSNLGYGDITAYTEMDAGETRIIADTAGTSGVFIDNIGSAALYGPKSYTVLVCYSALYHLLRMEVLFDSPGPPSAGSAKMRFYHIATDVPGNIQFWRDGTKWTEVNLDDFTAYYFNHIEPGTYAVQARATADTSHVLASANWTIAAGSKYTAIFAGSATGAGGYRLDLVNDSSAVYAPARWPEPTAAPRLMSPRVAAR